MATDPREVTPLSPEGGAWEAVAVSGDVLVAHAIFPEEEIVLYSLSTGEKRSLDHAPGGSKHLAPEACYTLGPPDLSGRYAAWLRTYPVLPGTEQKGQVVLADLVAGTEQVIDEGHGYGERVKVAGDLVCWMEHDDTGREGTSTLRVHRIGEGKTWSRMTFKGDADLGDVGGDWAVLTNPEQKHAVVAINLSDQSEVVLAGPGRNPRDFSVSGDRVLWVKKDVNGRFSRNPEKIQSISTDAVLSLISLPGGDAKDLAATSLAGEGRGPGNITMDGTDLGNAIVEGDYAAWVLTEYADGERHPAIVVRRLSDGAESRITRNGTIKALFIADGMVVWQEGAGPLAPCQVYCAVCPAAGRAVAGP
ncbi:hypothetical protein J2129_000954 [Methanofollis sp. W23]|uniref:hypothetical protein n=1 Tax=Methanofollis sp. W23 TaxID=2817849 RepID=UPI001AE560FC|nr:hypothetical protein [Methanofollis sp. W23]MBP2145500.1 hypothetical protein [Methanofollis sp. W23]